MVYNMVYIIADIFNNTSLELFLYELIVLFVHVMIGFHSINL